MMPAIPLCCVRIDLGSRKLTRKSLNVALVVRQVEVPVAGGDTWRAFRASGSS